MAEQNYIVSTDCGGTFVDCVIVDGAGAVHIGKAPNTPDHQSHAILAAVEAAAESAGLDVSQVLGHCRLFLNGTTTTTNAMVQRSGAVTGLITTRGFEDTLIIGRVKSRWVGLSESDLLDFGRVTRPAPVVPTRLTRGITERIDNTGSILVPVDLAEVERQIDDLVAQGIESLAICLLWSFRNPAHEIAVARLARGRHPALHVVASHELVPTMGEYERCNTTAVEAYIGPILSLYLERLDGSLRGAGYQGELLVMQSVGGLAPAHGLTEAAVSTLQSGPAGGIIATQKLGEQIGQTHLITADMGGTTFDVGLVVDGQPQTGQMSVVERNLLLVPAVEVTSIGAGGGSLAWLDSAQALHVGPRSQGANPGPACYGRGGTLPTVTDADVVLGYINPDTFLGGRMKLDARLAREALERHIARPLGTSVEEAAQAVYDIVNAHMADLIRSVLVGKGHDPRDFSMVAFGGCGPTHATGYGADAQVRQVIVPGAATVFSAQGIAQSRIKHFYSASCPRTLAVAGAVTDGLAVDLEAQFARLDERAGAQLARDRIAPTDRQLRRSVDLRYRKQVHELTIPLPGTGPVSQATLARLVDDFHRQYERLYGTGSSMASATVDIVMLRVEALGAEAPLLLAASGDDTASSADPREAFIVERKVWWGPKHRQIATPTYRMERLRPGHQIAGPAVIEHYGTTIPLHPGQHASVDRWRNLVLTFPAPAGTMKASGGPHA
jgi:N-methylhydantoinase A